MTNKKSEILLLTHGGWGEKLIDSIKMIFGSTDRITEIPLMASETFQEYYKKVRNKVSNLSENSLLMADLYGGTTSNVSAKLSQEFKINVVSGLNANMLLEAVASIDNLGDREVVERIVASGKHGCKNVLKEIQLSMNSEK